MSLEIYFKPIHSSEFSKNSIGRIVDSHINSFPEWESDVKYINDAVVRYGKLFTLKSIVDAKQTMSLKIKLMRKKWYA